MSLSERGGGVAAGGGVAEEQSGAENLRGLPFATSHTCMYIATPHINCFTFIIFLLLIPPPRVPFSPALGFLSQSAINAFIIISQR